MASAPEPRLHGHGHDTNTLQQPFFFKKKKERTVTIAGINAVGDGISSSADEV